MLVGFSAATGLVVVSVVLFSLVIAAAMFLRRTLNRETIEEWEEYWPHRFDYKELRIATRGFQDENLLGYGGFGMVYKGFLPRSGQEVVVKCITTEFKEGMKGFVAEISNMGRLQTGTWFNSEDGAEGIHSFSKPVSQAASSASSGESGLEQCQPWPFTFKELYTDISALF